MKRKRKIRKSLKNTFKIILLLTILGYGGYYFHTIEKPLNPIKKDSKEYYYSNDFGYVFQKSKMDYNNNGIDDYTDILNGAQKVAEQNPKYKDGYYDGGYPPEGEGVCTDLIASSLIEAGYYIKDLMAKDIRQTYKQNVYGIKIIDDNIDYRRVTNQEIFYQRYFTSLETDYNAIGEFQAGDIITFDDSSHIAIISNKRNKNGIPYVIQNSDPQQTQKEEDVLEQTDMQITGHYRFTYNEKLEKLIN